MCLPFTLRHSHHPYAYRVCSDLLYFTGYGNIWIEWWFDAISCLISCCRMKNTAIMAVNVCKQTVESFIECMLFSQWCDKQLPQTHHLYQYSKSNTHRVHSDNVNISKLFGSLKLEIWCRYSNDIVSSTTHKSLLVVYCISHMKFDIIIICGPIHGSNIKLYSNYQSQNRRNIKTINNRYRSP